jgi:hypothetical protein
MTREEFEETVGLVLRDHRMSTTAELTDELVAYWDGHALAYVTCKQGTSGAAYHDFVMNDDRWNSLRSRLEAWIDAPRFGFRPEAHHWLSEAPPGVADI